jgi:hypothetical protein
MLGVMISVSVVVLPMGDLMLKTVDPYRLYRPPCELKP